MNSNGTSSAVLSSSSTISSSQDRPPPVGSSQTALPASGGLYRSPPPIPTSSPPRDEVDSGTSTTTTPSQPPPQAPIRSNLNRSSRAKLSTNTDFSTPASRTAAPNIDQQSNNSDKVHENATDAAARLVYKSVMMGSIPSLSNNTTSQKLQVSIEQDKIPNMGINMITETSLGGGDNSKDIITSIEKPPPVPPQSSSKIQHQQQQTTTQRTSPTPRTNLARTSSNAANSSHKPNNTSSNNNVLPWIPISGETIINREENEPIYSEIIFVMPDNRGIRGKLFISNFRLYFRSDESYSFNNYHSNIIIDLPLGLINRIEKIGHQSSKQVNFYGILISCKNGRRLRFANTQLRGSRKQIYELLQKYAFPISNGLSYFAYSYNQIFADNSGWQVYDMKQEYERMGILKSTDWRFSTVNMDFKFCETYPKLLVVPQMVKDDELRQVGEFRSKHRIPVVSWLKYDNRKNSVALLRSSQPMVGLTQKRNERDESYLHTLYKINTINSLDKLFIMDARPIANAMANRATGGGYESEDNYKDCEICFLNIHNIHVMRESLRKIFDMAMPPSSSASSSSSGHHHQQSGSHQQSQTSSTVASLVGNNPTSSHHRSTSFGGAAGPNVGGGGDSSANNRAVPQPLSHQQHSLNDDRNFFVNLENSKWLEYIKSILNGALRIVRYIHGHNASVLVHCSDGWDRTAQLTSLSMLMMDKYYRTIKGFQVLIEKEWIQFGHRFGTRMGHGSDKYSDQDRSPIFLQFIDCVWQILQQNSKVFEFNEKLLLTIVNNMYTCQFGTFLYNNEFEREKHDVRNKTVSLWSYINSYKSEFRNNAYIEYDGVVECSTSLSSLQLWVAYYFQYREVIDDSLNDVTVNSISAANQAVFSSTMSNNQNSYTFTPPMPSSRMFGQAFFQQVVSQMKATVRNHAPQEPELVRYKACVQTSDIS